MDRRYIYIVLVIIILGVSILGSTNTNDVIGSSNPQSTESGNIGSHGSSESEGDDSVKNSISIIDDETTADMLNINVEDIESLTIDEKTGETCNNYIPTLMEDGIATYTINKDNDIFDYFCSQTLGVDNYDELGIVNEGVPLMIGGGFTNIIREPTVQYFVTMIYYKEDIYVACILEYDEFPGFGELNPPHFQLATIDSHEYFTPQKYAQDENGNPLPEWNYSDIEISGHYYSEYKEELAQLSNWDSFDLEEQLNYTPPEEQLDLEIFEYDFLMKLLNNTQELAKEELNL